MVPVHLWLPEAHVEAPTAGSVILAGILLKLGTYGFLRFSFPLFPEASLYFSPMVYLLSVVGIVYTSFTAIRQTDFKRIIAYTSVAHMNLVMVGLFSFNTIGLEGAILQSLSHGFVASALFLIIGIIYERHHTRMVKYYGGIVHTMPLYTSIFLFFTMANIGLKERPDVLMLPLSLTVTRHFLTMSELKAQQYTVQKRRCRSQFWTSFFYHE